jgi:hypothetical protein
MKKRFISLKESVLGQSDNNSIVNVNPVVDPSAALTDPMNTKFVPKNDLELSAAFAAAAQSTKLSPEEAFEKVEAALKDDDIEGDMKTKNSLEEEIRQQIRSILKEETWGQLRRTKPQSTWSLYPGIEDKVNNPDATQVPVEILQGAYSRSDKARPSKREKDAATVAGLKTVGDLPPVTKIPATGAVAGQKKFEKDPSLIHTFNKMLPDIHQISREDAKNFSTVAKKIADVLDPLHSATLKKIAGMLKKIVDDYNGGVAKDAKFNLKDMKTDVDLAEQYANFLEFVGGDDSPVSEEDFDKLQPSLESLHTAMMDPYQLLWQGEKIAPMKVAGDALRGWINKIARVIKDEPALRGDEEGRSRINLSQEFFLKNFKEHLSSLKIDSQTILELCNQLMEAFNDESPANMTNILSQKLIQTAFLNLWEREFIEPFGIADLFVEKETGRHASLTKGFQDLATLSSQQKGKSAGKTVDYLKQLISNVLEAMRSDSEDEDEFNAIQRGDLSPSQIKLAKELANSMDQNQLMQIIQENPAFEEEIFGPDDIVAVIQNLDV